MKVFVQTADRPTIKAFPFFEVYATKMEITAESLGAFWQHLKADFPKAKRVLIALTPADFAFKQPGEVTA